MPKTNLLDIVDVLETYADLYDMFDDNRLVYEALDKVNEELRAIPYVKAISVEWILNYRKNNRGEITYYSIDAIDHMLSEWCEESNIDMWDMINGWEKENERLV